ncbi:amino acid adenylation domain-containing protein [Mucilaginibacter frigoritolerans]|uniref:Amino acid adenylation domain-containing protein n=1 Tax=Mucilaginibacter frigoritolerans TaxID=652788 RepID=A0A562U5N5_9SPHI|nr:amino acid adenylation domain-containing protein [Mucilaginibacter frigoritolerans]TWJ00637.1 amino acid adenylation domain-containing protein [Mucilaginibacter frigoritolerans]
MNRNISTYNGNPPDLAKDHLPFKALHHYIDECVKKYPHRTAIKFNDSIWSYQTLCEHSNKLAKLLIDNGIQKGDIVGVAVDRSPEMIVSLLAILKTGAAYLPLDPLYPKDRVEFMLLDSCATMLLTSKKYQKYFLSNATELLIEDAWEKLETYDPGEPGISVNLNCLAYILYTSGSSGTPKGVMVTHQNLLNFLFSMQKTPGINAEDKLLAISTISFDIAGLELYLPLISGAQIVLVSTETAQDGWLLLDVIKKEKITIMQATPYAWQMIIAAGWDYFLPLKIICGGEPLTRHLAELLLSRCNELWNQYGPTETTVYSTQKLIKSADDITIGKPINNTTIYVLDELQNNLSHGETGEIFIGGDGVTKGYINKPYMTAERFINDPFSEKPLAKMYRTGDLGRFTKNGEIQCLGRMDNQVKVRGYRIELEEIEHALMKEKDIKDAIATVRKDSPGGASLAAYMVLNADAKNTGTELRKAELKKMLLKNLPAYMVPDHFVFIPFVPLTPNGKIDRNALPKPNITGEHNNTPYIAPVTELEKQLASAWRDLMGIEQIGIYDNFFELGGHSLVAVQIMARIKKVTGKRLPIAALLKYPTIGELSIHLNDTASNWQALVAIKPNGSKPPLYIIHGEGLNVLYFSSLAINLDKEQPVYGLQARGLEGDAPLEVMEEIAASYVKEILDQNPTGPYLLAGYSFGGYVAVEMRRQLVERGKNVRVIIFDTDAEKSKYKSWSYLLPRKIKRHLPTVIASVKYSLSHPSSAFRNVLERLRVKPKQNEESKEFYRQIKKVRNKLRIALANYSIEPFNDNVYLFKAKICTHYIDDTEFLGWKKYAKKGVEINEVPGDHLSMLLHPNVEDFASVLQRSINEF